MEVLPPNQLDGVFKKKAAVRPARRRQAQEDDPEDSVDSPVAGNKKSGWDDVGSEAGAMTPAVPVRRRRDHLDDEDSPLKKHTMDDDEVEETPIIPDLEDEQEDMARQVATAPSLKSSRVQRIQELDAEIDMALPSAGEVGVDLGVLQALLIPREQLQEDDVPWDPEKELATIASEMALEQAERDPDGELAAAQAAAAPAASAPLRKRG